MIQINENSPKAIYQQVYDGLLNLIVLKVLSADDKLPSVRELALMLKINPNTIQKAYKALEQDGFIYSLPGKGNFVMPDKDVKRVYESTIQKELKIMIHSWLGLGVKKDQILVAVHNILEAYDDRS